VGFVLVSAAAFEIQKRNVSGDEVGGGRLIDGVTSARSGGSAQIGTRPTHRASSAHHLTGRRCRTV
jgi:hypothetical protein